MDNDKAMELYEAQVFLTKRILPWRTWVAVAWIRSVALQVEPE